MLVPETAMYENHLSQTGEYEVGAAREVFAMQSKAISKFVVSCRNCGCGDSREKVMPLGSSDDPGALGLTRRRALPCSDFERVGEPIQTQSTP
jgi:hypothetical protein